MNMDKKVKKKFNTDVLIIGGGINGAGCARDLSLRGIKVVLVEKNDFASETTGASSAMIHGGMRYLQYNRTTTYHSCIDAGYIKDIIKYNIFRIPFLFPIKDEGIKSWIYLQMVESFFSAYDKFSKLKGGKPHIFLNKEETLKIEPGLDKSIIGSVTMDEWGIDPFRLTIANILDAKRNGAVILNHCEFIDFIREDVAIRGGIVKNLITGEFYEIKSRIVLNTAGPWTEEIAKRVGAKVKLRPAKGIHIIFDRRLVNYAIIFTTIDGRSIFIQPHQNTTILGTTDDDFYGDLNDHRANIDEVEYLLQACERFLPWIREARMITTISGIRPTLFEWGKNEDALSRDHKVFDHEELEGIIGFISLAGGKLASYRLMAEEVCDLIAVKLGNREKSKTKYYPLPGGEKKVKAEELARKYQIPEFIAKRILFKYGSLSERLLEEATKEERNLIVCNCELVTLAEVKYCLKYEFVFTLADLSRRTRLGMGPCQGCNCMEKALFIMAKKFNWDFSKIREELKRFLDFKWKGTYAILLYGQLAQEYFKMNKISTFIYNKRNEEKKI